MYQKDNKQNIKEGFDIEIVYQLMLYNLKTRDSIINLQANTGDWSKQRDYNLNSNIAKHYNQTL